MGNAQSENYNTKSIVDNTYMSKYNLIPSLPGHEYETITIKFLKKKYDLDSLDKVEKYVDLRSNFPNIINIGNIPLNPIAAISYIIHYALLKNNLPIFPPSIIYIFNNLQFYKNVTSIMNLDIIFQSLLQNGFCSESELRTCEENIQCEVNSNVRDKAVAFKFINIHKVENNLDTMKILIKNKYPILIGFTVYYDLSNVDSFMWMPDKSQDKKIGGLAGVIVGYIDDRKMFIVAQTFGDNFGERGYVLMPYEYVLDENYTFEKYILDFNSDRVRGYISQRREMISLEQKPNTEVKQVYKKDMFNSLFS